MLKIDLFGLKARRVLYELGKAAAHRHVLALQDFLRANAAADCPQTIEVPLSVILDGRFTEKPGPEWGNATFMKGFVDLLRNATPQPAKLERLKERDVSHFHLRERGKHVPLELVCLVAVIVQTKRIESNVVDFGARVRRA